MQELIIFLKFLSKITDIMRLKVSLCSCSVCVCVCIMCCLSGCYFKYLGAGLCSLICKTKQQWNNFTTLSQTQLQNRTIATRSGFFGTAIIFFGLKRNKLLAVHTGYFHTPISREIIFEFFVAMLLNEPKYDLLGVGGGVWWVGVVEISDSCLSLYTGK